MIALKKTLFIKILRLNFIRKDRVSEIFSANWGVFKSALFVNKKFFIHVILIRIGN